MSPRDQLQDAFTEWRRIAHAEEAAIRRQDWQALEVCHLSVRDLQPRITQLTGEIHRECEHTGADPASADQWLRDTIAELIELETRNIALLDQARQSGQAQLNDLQQSGRTLRRVQRSYSPARAASWTTFS
jgi:hypothetical protein